MGDASLVIVCESCASVCIDDVWYADASLDEILEHRVANVVMQGACPACSDASRPISPAERP